MAAKPEFIRNLPGPCVLAERAVTDYGTTARNRGSRRAVTFNLAESPLAWLHARGHLTDRQLLAGEALRGDYEAAALGPHVTMSWENIPLSRQKRGAPNGLNRTEWTMQAKARFEAALEALGPDLSDIVWRVICVGESVPAAEREMSWPVRSGKLVLKIALERLAAFYQIPG